MSQFECIYCLDSGLRGGEPCDRCDLGMRMLRQAYRKQWSPKVTRLGVFFSCLIDLAGHFEEDAVGINGLQFAVMNDDPETWCFAVHRGKLLGSTSGKSWKLSHEGEPVTSDLRAISTVIVKLGCGSPETLKGLAALLSGFE